jgi:NAD+ kinase
MAAPSKPIRTIGLFGKYGSKEVGDVIRRLCTFLRDRGLAVLLEEATAEFMEPACAESRPLAALGREIDLALVVGGDGTMLHVAREFAPHGVPLVGVNLGRLGFLTDIPTNRMEDELARILDGDFKAEERILLEAEIVRYDQVQHVANALNDVVINKGALARLIEFETWVEGEFVSSTRADGIIVATPTGSTAYALSAGGPILHPTLPAIVIVPICPHTLSDRPLTIGSDSGIEIVMTATSRQSAHVTFDGQTSFAVYDGDRVRVRRAARPATLLHPSRRSHYEVLRVKLGWSEQY